MSLSKLGVGVIGTGMAATPHAKALNDLRDHIDLRGVFSRNAEKCKTFASRFELPFIKNIEDLINDPKLDIIIIITPPNQRLKLVQRSSAKAKMIVNLCKEKNVKLGIVFQHRFRESSQKLKKLILSHSLGSIFTVQVQVPWWRDQSYYDEPGRGSYERDGGGVLISQAIHTLDLMLSLTGPVSEVQALSSTSQFHKMESEDFVAGGLKFKSGASGSIFASTSSFPGNAESITLNCEKASAHLQSGVLTIKWLDGRTEKFGETSGTGGGADPMAFPHDWHRDLIDNFVKSVQNKYNSLISGEEALNVHELIDALIESSNKGKLITI